MTSFVSNEIDKMSMSYEDKSAIKLLHDEPNRCKENPNGIYSKERVSKLCHDSKDCYNCFDRLCDTTGMTI